MIIEISFHYTQPFGSARFDDCTHKTNTAKQCFDPLFPLGSFLGLVTSLQRKNSCDKYEIASVAVFKRYCVEDLAPLFSAQTEEVEGK